MSKSKSQNFKLEYFTRGGSYSANVDYRRFTTMDYNLESYIGIVGVGIIKGWQLGASSGLNIQITPGKGVINGYVVESQYSYKQRSDMVMGDWEIEEIHDITNKSTKLPVTYPYLTDSYPATNSRTNYIAIIQAYNPSYVPPANIENCYVKTATVSSITVNDNALNYIYASKISSLSYPISNDYPPTNFIMPSDKNYPNYHLYHSAIMDYNNSISLINNYEWRKNSVNHFTAVKFIASASIKNSSNYILLGRVLAYGGAIESIDTIGVENLENMEAAIKKAAKNLISHRHGGNSYFDPAKIKLQTDIRKAAIGAYNPTNQEAIFNVLENQLTGVMLGHQHDFYFYNNSAGSFSGYTVDKLGSTSSHYHAIFGNVASGYRISGTYPADYINGGHSHSLPDLKLSDGWDSSSPFAVYFNGTTIATQDTNTVNANSNAKTLTITGMVPPSIRTYLSTFSVVIGINQDGTNILDTYSLTHSSFNVLSFMQYMIVDFNNKYSGISNKNNPFIFTNSDGTINTAATNRQLQDLYDQSLVAQYLLQSVGDKFTFTPFAANNVSISLLSESTMDYDIEMELIENTEVHGKLSPENITYVNAQKILVGEFDIAKIPQISHVGRMNLEVFPIKYSMSSNDGISYYILPAVTDPSLNHYHDLKIDKTKSGVTTGPFVSGDPVLYATGKDGKSYYIDHIHGVTNSNVSSASSSGLLSWTNDINSSNSTSSDHIHNIIFPSTGNEKNIYSILEAKDGSIYMGTSNGLMVIPNGDAYLYVINGHKYYMVGTDLWQLLLKAKGYYEKDTSKILNVTQEIYGSQISKAYITTSNNGDAYMMHGYIDPKSGQDLVLIKRVTSFEVPNLQYQYLTSNPDQNNLGPNDTLKDILYYPGESSEFYPFNELYDEVYEGEANAEPDDFDENGKFKPPPNPSKIFIINKQISDTPIWSMDISKVTNSTSENILIAGCDIFAQNYDLSSDFYKGWTTPQVPGYIGSIKKIYSDSSGTAWIVANGGISISSSYASIIDIAQPGISSKINDVVEGSAGTIYVAGYDGIYKTQDYGASWTRIFFNENGCSQIIRDYSNDKTNTILNHYHTFSVNREGDGNLNESIGFYTPHSHAVSSWNIQPTLAHTHDLISTFYCVTNNDGFIYKSNDSGATWNKIGVAPIQEHGDIFVMGNIFTSLSDGLYILGQNGKWEKIFPNIIYSYSYGYMFDKVLLGGKNTVYVTSDFSSFENLFEMDGYPNSSLYINDTPKYFNYYRSNKDNSIRFKDFLSSTSPSFAIIDYAQWIIPGGGWDDSILYDIYINNKLALSTKRDIDNRDLYGYHFLVDNINGILNFGVTRNIIDSINVGDQSFNVDNSTGFAIGDKIFIKSDYDIEYVKMMGSLIFSNVSGNSTLISSSNTAIEAPLVFSPLGGDSLGDGISQESIPFPPPVIPEDAKNNSLYQRASIKNGQIYAYIANIVGNKIYIDYKSDVNIMYPAKVVKIVNFDDSSKITANIYESHLSNVGQFTHEEIEDNLSKFYNGKPYQFNNSFLSVLLQLTQGLKYVYPDIDYKYKNYNYYDFNYSWLTNDPNLPYIGDYIDLDSCDINNFLIFSNTFFERGAKQVNKILFGKGSFVGIILVGTDIGVFYSKIETGLEGNWFYAKLTHAVSDLIQFGDVIYACTNEGLYTSTNVENWELNPAIAFPTTKSSLRWAFVISANVAPHTATFSNLPSPFSCGLITSTSNVYSQFQINKKVDIINAGNVSGTYTIKQINSASNVYTYETFPIGVSTSYNNVTMKGGTWWNSIENDTDPLHPNITNTLLIGGENSIVFLANPSQKNWQQSTLPKGVTNFNVSSFGLINNGILLAAIESTIKTDVSNYLISCLDSGTKWGIFRKFPEITGKIKLFSLTEFNHTKLSISFDTTYIYMDGNIKGQNISIFSKLSPSAPIYRSTIIWNENSNNKDYIYVLGNDLTNILSSRINDNVNDSFTFVVSPIKINSIVQTSVNDILFGTDNGIYSDEKTTLVPTFYAGTITGIGYGGVVSNIDVNGKISSVNQNLNNGTTNFNIVIGQNISYGDLINHTIYITDLVNVLSANIINNSESLVNGEVIINVDIPFISEYSNYVGKNIVVNNGQSSIVYLSWNSEVYENQFAGGVMTVTSNENYSYGKMYDIISNTNKYIVVSQSSYVSGSSGAEKIATGIIPSSTLTNAISSDLVVGQTVRVNDADGRVAVFVSYNDNIPIKNQISGAGIMFSDSSNPIVTTVYSNDLNIVTLNAVQGATSSPLFEFSVGSTFSISGSAFNPIFMFNNKETSINESHYHDISLIGKTITGEVQSFSNISTSYVDINITNESGFDNPILLNNEKILENAKVYFTNPEDQTQIVQTSIISATSTSIRVNIQDYNSWDFLNKNYYKVSIGWLFSIHSMYYGQTENIYYNDFNKINVYITKTLIVGDTNVSVTSTTGMISGDKVQIYDEILQQETNSILSIVNDTNIILKNPVYNKYEKANNPSLKVLSNVFSNYHTHRISNLQLETITVQDYVPYGYSPYHSHNSLPAISSVSKIMERGGNIYAIGSSENIFSSYNIYNDWILNTNINNFLENNDHVSGITDMEIDSNNKFVISTNNGYIATEDYSSGVVSLIKPIIG